jgi:hypothetical protein
VYDLVQESTFQDEISLYIRRKGPHGLEGTLWRS